MPDITLLTSQLASTPAKPERPWNIRVSPVVARSRNPIRSTLASITACAPSTSKTPINLGLGDPTFYPLHPPPPAAIAAVRDALDSGKANGYIPGAGTVVARQAVAEYHQRWDNVPYLIDNIVLTHGVAQALDLVFSVLIPPSGMEASNILLPRPGFAIYATLLANLGTEVRYYDCIEENNWEADLEMMARQCDDQTRAIIITNPSNPCGSNFSRSHLEAIVDIAHHARVPIIADEIYHHMVWDAPFIPLASLSTSVPVITLAGLSKRFLVPGWRVGWAALHDPLGVAESIRDGLAVWSNRFFGPDSLLQAALPAILQTPPEWFDEVTAKVKANAEIVHTALSTVPGLSCSKPEGALYILVRINLPTFPDFADDVEFSTALYREQAMFVLPGLCFDAPGYVRFVIASPEDVMREAGDRLREFCEKYRVM